MHCIAPAFSRCSKSGLSYEPRKVSPLNGEGSVFIKTANDWIFIRINRDQLAAVFASLNRDVLILSQL